METVAHQLDAKERTNDVVLSMDAPFSKMMLSDCIVKGLTSAGFIYPTVIQANAIRIGKSGVDLIIQSKSGTGKTITFCIILLESYDPNNKDVQSLIVTPTREIAIQIETVLNQVAKFVRGFRAVSVIGGQDFADDRHKIQGAKAIVGTPGRLLHLIRSRVLNTSQIKLFIVDEVDKMISNDFQVDLTEIRYWLPNVEQTIGCTATFPEKFREQISSYMSSPIFITLKKQQAMVLLGIKQFVYEFPEEKTSIMEMTAKLQGLKHIFCKLAFKQCLIFAGSQSRAESFHNLMQKEGWTCDLLTGMQCQATRSLAFSKFISFQTRILFTTDLMARGIDSEYVNLVINLDLPDKCDTYLHRIGRAGRFGTRGISISFVSSKSDYKKFAKIAECIDSKNLKFPTGNVSRDFWDFSDTEKDEEVFGVFKPLYNDFNVSNGTDNNVDANNMIENGNNTFNVGKSNETGDINKLSVASSAQIFPSSNTIDDASSIAVDSEILQSHQIDSNDHNIPEIIPNNITISSLLNYLIDDKTLKSVKLPSTESKLLNCITNRKYEINKRNLFSEYNNLQKLSSSTSQNTQPYNLNNSTFTINAPETDSDIVSRSIHLHLRFPSPAYGLLNLSDENNASDDSKNLQVDALVNAINNVPDIQYDNPSNSNSPVSSQDPMEANREGSSSSYYTSGFDENTRSSCSSGIDVPDNEESYNSSDSSNELIYDEDRSETTNEYNSDGDTDDETYSSVFTEDSDQNEESDMSCENDEGDDEASSDTNSENDIENNDKEYKNEPKKFRGNNKSEDKSESSDNEQSFHRQAIKWRNILHSQVLYLQNYVRMMHGSSPMKHLGDAKHK